MVGTMGDFASFQQLLTMKNQTYCNLNIMRHQRGAAMGMLAIAASWPLVVSALDPDICASANTANMEKFTDNLQTNGLCHDHCLGDYAFSITKGYDCWCSNYAPAADIQVKLSSCNFPCWGYPDEPCGGDNGEYSYVRLRNVQPSGTRGSDEPSSTKTQPQKTSDPSHGIKQDTKTFVQDPETSQPSSTSEKSEAVSTTAESTSSSKSTSTKPTSTAVETVTADGTIKTVFVGPTGSPDGGDSNRSEGEEVNSSNGGGGGGGVSKGALAGIIVGVALGVIAIVAIGLWWFFRRRKNQQQEEDYQEDPSIRGSSSGMMGSGNRPDMSMGGGSPGSPNTNSNRNSALMIDPRMDPFKQGLYVRSASHESINTLRDDHDYSRRIQQRTLRATNPDPEPDG